MYAIIETGGKQFKVEEGMQVLVPEVVAEKGSLITFDRVLFCSDGEASVVGTPTVAGASVTAVCLGDAKGPKLVVFKMKSAKNMRRRTGHRQAYTAVRIGKIASPLPKPKPAPAAAQ